MQVFVGNFLEFRINKIGVFGGSHEATERTLSGSSNLVWNTGPSLVLCLCFGHGLKRIMLVLHDECCLIPCY